MAKTTQKDRTISIMTPLGEDYLLLERVHAEEKISELFEIYVDLLYDEEMDDAFDITVIDDKSIIGQPVTVKINQEDSGGRSLTGMVSDFNLIGRDRRYTHYSAKIVPHIWKLTRNFQSRIFQHKTVRDILREVFDGFKFDDQLQGDYKSRNYCVQYQESDFDFASRLMEEEGIYYYFEHTPEAEKLILRDDFNKPEDCPGKSEIPFFNEDLTPEWFESAIKSWQTVYSLQSGKVALWDYHFQAPTKKLEAEQTSSFNAGGNQKLEVYTYPGGYAKKYDDIDKSGGERQDVNNIFQDNRRTAKNRILMHDAQYKNIAGWSDCSTMTAGYRFQLKNHPNKEFNTKYILLSVVHDVEQSPGYMSSDTIPKDYRNEFVCIPHGSGCPEFRPVLKTPKPIMYGCQTAVVVGPGGEEIFTDKYGRVKVQFHWDRDGTYNPDSSCWLRVGTSIAGNKWGTMFIPRIGQEVIVDFLGGNPDEPIIVGSVYNPQTMPHYELPKYKTLSYYKSRTTPDDGKGFNEWRFEDKKGKEQVFIHSQKRMDVRVRQSLYETCGGNRQEVIGVRSSTYSGENYPGGNLAVTVGGNHDFHVKYDEFIGIDGKRYEKVVKDVVEGYKGDKSTIVTGKSEHNAREIIIEAGMKISLKVGGNCIVIDPTGITIAGTMVKINSGGFGTETSNPKLGNPLDAEAADTGEPGYLDRPRSGGGHGGRVWEQLNSQHYIAPPRPGEDARITAMRGTLAKSAQGRHSLEVYDRYGVEPTFNAGKGSSYDPNKKIGDKDNPNYNKTNLDPTQDPTTSALTFVHEMNHAEAHNENKSGDIDDPSKSNYVNTMVNEETEGTVRSIEARNELKDAGTDVSGAHFPLENEYQAAHDKAVADAKAANPNISDEDAEAAGKKAGSDAVKDGFNKGSVITSNTNEKYPDYYGNDWDKHAKSKKKP